MSKATLEDFQNLTSIHDLSVLLGFPAKKLSYILYKLKGGPNGQYTEFEIKKRSGATRSIAAPNTGLKEVQKRLSQKLQDIYWVKKSVHGFVGKRGILSNATNHAQKRFVFNVDLKDFFPSIHFGRVLGLFSARPYQCPKDVAILLAKIACYQDKLPQGSPCSPVIANMICAYMDKQLSDLAKETGCYYTRYADDLTFSTNKLHFPEEIANHTGIDWEVGNQLNEIVENNGFTINDDKTSMRTRSDRQLVTGIVVNDHPNIRRKTIKQIRAMLHDWKVNGLENAQEKYVASHDLNNRPESREAIDFTKVVRGKIEHVRHVRNFRMGILNKIDQEEAIRNRAQYKRRAYQSFSHDQYYKYFERFTQLIFRDCGSPVILGEGETDWMHLRKAFADLQRIGKFPDLKLHIHKHSKHANGGYTNLVDFCNNAKDLYVKFERPVICVYDCDIPNVNKEHEGEKFIAHGNNVFSMLLQRPSHRKSEMYSIEQLYPNEDLQKKDKFGRRLFLSTEFNKKGIHKENPSWVYGKRASDGKEVSGVQKTLSGHEKVIDNAVCDSSNGKRISVAMSKRDFAIKIMRMEYPFNEMDFSGFEDTFKIVEEICTR